MKKALTFAALTLVVVATMGASSCDSSNLMSASAGPYDGVLIYRSGQSSSQTLVTGQVTASSAADVALRVVETANKAAVWNFAVHANSSSKIVVTSPGFITGSPVLTKDKNSKYCFSTTGTGPVTPANPTMRLCYDGTGLSLSFAQSADREYTFELDRHVAADHPTLETPKIYTVSDLLLKAKNKSFTSKLAFESAVESHLNSKTAYLNLLPHISLNTIMSLASFTVSPTSIIGLIGDLAPFLLPTNWIQADEARWQSNAEYYAWLLMKANSGNIAEGMSYVLLRDRAVLASLKAYEAPLAEMRDIVHEKEILGLLPKGSTNAPTTILTSLQETETQLSQFITEENRNLALAAGFTNPDSITAIIDDSSVSIETPTAINLADIQNVVIDRSIELKQLDSLIHAAHDDLLNREFGWISPSGSVGFGLPTTIMAGRARVSEIMIQRDQLKAILLQKVENAADQTTSALHTYSMAKANAETLKSRFDQLHDGLVNGLAVSVTDLQVAIQDKMKGDNDLINAKYTYYTASGMLNRMLMTGAYLDILSRVNVNFDDKRP